MIFAAIDRLPFSSGISQRAIFELPKMSPLPIRVQVDIWVKQLNMFKSPFHSSTMFDG